MRAPAIRILTPQRRSLARGLSRDLPLKAAALGLAVALWLLVSAVVPREVVAPFDGRVPVERPEVPAGYTVRGTLPDVSVRLRGPEPLVVRMSQEQLRATVDISALVLGSPEPQEAPVRVTVADERVSVVEVSPATVPIRIETVVSRSVTVQPRFANEPATGFRRGEAQVSPAEVGLTGAASLVGAVTAVYATVRFGDIGVDLVQSAQPVAVDASGAAVEGVTIEPAAVQVRVPVLSIATTRTVSVLHDVRGVPANGHWIAAVSAAPVAITVRGGSEALATLETVRTAPYDVSGISASRTVRVPIFLPEGVEMLEPVDATLTITVQVLQGTRPFPLVAVTATGVGEGLVAEIDPASVEVVLAGPVPTLAAAGPLEGVVDMTGRAPGTYVVDVTVRAPAGLEVRSVQPPRVTVTIKQR